MSSTWSIRRKLLSRIWWWRINYHIQQCRTTCDWSPSRFQILSNMILKKPVRWQCCLRLTNLIFLTGCLAFEKQPSDPCYMDAMSHYISHTVQILTELSFPQGVFTHLSHHHLLSHLQTMQICRFCCQDFSPIGQYTLGTQLCSISILPFTC